jgi:hypothetical protein
MQGLFQTSLMMLIVSISLCLPHFASAKLESESQHLNSLRRYCSLLLNKAELSGDPLVAPAVKHLIEELLKVEKENLQVTARYRQEMKVRADLRQSINQALNDTDISVREWERLEQSLVEIRDQMRVLTATHLRRTSEFETKKESINTDLAGLTGEDRAIVEALKNRFFADKARR